MKRQSIVKKKVKQLELSGYPGKKIFYHAETTMLVLGETLENTICRLASHPLKQTLEFVFI